MWPISLHYCISLILCCSWSSVVAWPYPGQGRGRHWPIPLHTPPAEVAPTGAYRAEYVSAVQLHFRDTWLGGSSERYLYYTHPFNFASVFWVWVCVCVCVSVCVCVCMRVWLIARDQDDKLVMVKEWLHSSLHLCKVYHLALLDLIQQPLIISGHVDGWMQVVLWCLGRRWPGLSGWIMNPWSMERTSHSPKKKNLWQLMVQHF